MNAVLSVIDLGKAFRTYKSESQRIRSWFNKRIKARDEHWVLRNISFDVPAGSAVGIVGQNGAGKSTLLKLITGTLVPNEGHIRIAGTVGSILELGMGFNPALTGRQNALHSLSLMGYLPDEIGSVIGQIEAFAEIGDYFDQPARVYSSGMQMRVGFAAITAFRPDILIVDEALSVGDAYFQHKSFNRIREFREKGTALLIVSHDRAAIMSLCDRALVLHEGRIVKDAEPAEAMDFYNAIIGEQGIDTVRVVHNDGGRSQTLSGTGEATVTKIELLDIDGTPVDIVEVGQQVCLHIQARAIAPIERLVLGYMLRDRLGQAIYGTNTHLQDLVQHDVEAGEMMDFRFSFDARLGPGSYSVSTALTSSENHHQNNYEWRDLALVFEVINGSRIPFAGCNWMNPAIAINRHAPAARQSTGVDAPVRVPS